MTIFTQPIGLAKRIAILLVMVLLGVFFGRDVIASALVARCDQYLNGPGDLQTALGYAQRARLFDPTFPDAAQRIGLIAIRTRQRAMIEQAAEIDGAAIKRAPHFQDLRVEYAELLFALKQYRNSSLSWASLAEDYPANAMYVGWAAEAARYAGDCQLVNRYFSQLVSKHPRDRRSRRILREFATRQQAGKCIST